MSPCICISQLRWFSYRRRRPCRRVLRQHITSSSIPVLGVRGVGGVGATYTGMMMMLSQMCLYMLLYVLALCMCGVHAAGGPNAVDAIRPNEWTGDMKCLPGSWRDFSFEVNSKEMLNNNWLFEVEDLKPELEGYRTDALSVHLFTGEIPLDRKSGMVATEAKNRLYTLEISYYDVKMKTYYLGVRCGDETTTFRVLARGVVAPLTEDEKIEGEACEEQLVYHKFEAPPFSNGLARVQVQASSEGANSALLVMQHADTAPLRLRPPFKSLAPGEVGVINVCWLAASHTYYVALKTASGCVPYTIQLSFPSADFAEEACYTVASRRAASPSSRYESVLPTGAAAGGGHDIQHFPELEHNHFLYGKTTPFSYSDFRVHVGDADRDDNMVIFLEDLAVGPINPRAFGLYLYPVNENVPVDRHTEYKSEYSVDGEYSITINKWDLKKGDYVVSVYSTSPTPMNFRMVPYFIHSGIKPGGHASGFVCPGQFVFHYVQVGDDVIPHRRAAAGSDSKNQSASFVDVHFNLDVATGDLFYLTSHLMPPLKLSPPYQHAEAIGANHTTPICHAETGRQYIGLAGGEHCAEYEIYADVAAEQPTCTELKHICKKDCEIQCTEMLLHHYEYDSCVPGEYKDFMLTVTEAEAASNLIFEVQNLADGVMPHALGVYLYKNEIPPNRESAIKEEYSADGVWAIVVSEHDLQAARYYLSVKCTGDEAVRFRVLAELSHSDLHIGELANGEVGPETWAHYHYTVPDSAEMPQGYWLDHLGWALPYMVTFHLRLFTGDIKMRTAVDYPPIKLIPPYLSSDASEHRPGGAYENNPMPISTCVLPGHTEYLGVLGGDHFATFQVSVTAEPVSDVSECDGQLHRRRQLLGAAGGSSSADSSSAGTVIDVDHFMRASCQPHEWVDFKLPKNDKYRDCNVVFEVEDLDRGYTQSGLGLFVYKNAIPSNRVTEFKSTETPDGHYSVTLNAWDYDSKADLFASVRCGDQPKSFRLLTEVIQGEVKEGTHARGYVCPGDFIYHFFDAGGGHDDARHRAIASAASDSSPPLDEVSDVNFEIVLHTGRVAYKTSHGEPALKLIPPYRTASSEQYLAGNFTFVHLCGIEPGSGLHYLALLGMDKCADYELYVHLKKPSNTCAEPKHEVEDARLASGVEDIKPDHFTYSSCEPGEIKDFHMYIGVKDAVKNLRMEATNLDASSAEIPDALSIALYDGQIPASRHSEFTAGIATDGVLSLGVSYHDLHQGDFFLSVKCGARPVSFRILALLIDAKIKPGSSIHGVVCKGNWVYHSYDVSALIPGGANHSAATEKMSLEFELDIHEGDLYYMIQATQPPIRFSPPYRHASQHVDGKGHNIFSASTCEIGHFDVATWYFAVRGGDECADYSITARIKDHCGDNEFSHEKGLVTTVQALPLRENHFVYSTCELGEYKDFFLDVSAEDAKNNMVFNVEDLSDHLDPESLRMELTALADFIPTPRAPSKVLQSSRGGRYSIALDYTQLQAGRYYVSVRCMKTRISFRVSPNLVISEIKGVAKVIGSVSPGEWVYHYRKSDGNASKPHMRWSVHVNTGDLYLASERTSYPPGFATKIENNFQMLMSADAQDLDVFVCDADTKSYLGLYGGDYVVDYVVTSETFAGECTTKKLPGYKKSSKGEKKESELISGLSTITMVAIIYVVVIVCVFVYVLGRRAYSMTEREARLHVQEEQNGEEKNGKAMGYNTLAKATYTTPPPGPVTEAFRARARSFKQKPQIQKFDTLAKLTKLKRNKPTKIVPIEEKANELFGELREHFHSKEEAIFAMEKAGKMGVRRKLALAELEERKAKKEALVGASIYVVATIVYFTILLLQRDIKLIWKTESALKNYFSSAQTLDGTSLMDLNDQAQIFDWLENGFLEKVYPEPVWYNGDSWTKQEQNYILQYQRLVSGFALKQRRVQVNASSCISSRRFSTFYPSCWTELSRSSESRDAFGPSFDPQKYEYRASATGGGYSVDFPIDRTLSLLTLREMQSDRFLDKQTRTVTLEVTLYNAMAHFFSVVDLHINFTPTGKVLPSFSIYTFPLELYLTPVDWFRACLEICFFLFVMASLGSELTELVEVSVRPLRVKFNGYTYLSDMWNFLDLARLITWSIVCFWYVMILTEPNATSLSLPLHADTESAHLNDVAVLWKNYQSLNGIIIILCLFTIFKHLNRSPEHGVLIRTIARASGNLVRFMIIFTLVFVYFGVMGTVMFGSALEEFSDVWRSIQVLFMMMTGEYGYEPIYGVSQVSAPIFYYTYLILVFFLLLNILLAILMNTYEAIQEDLEAARERAAKRHPHSVLRELYYETYRWVANLSKLDSIEPPLFLNSDDMAAMLSDDNKDMIQEARRVKVTERHFGMLSAEFDEIVDAELLRKYFPEEAVVLMLVSVGDNLEKLEEGVIPEDDDEITQQSGDVNETQRSGRRDSPEAWPDDDGVMSTRSKDPVNVDSSSKIDEIIAKLVEAKNLMSR